MSQIYGVKDEDVVIHDADLIESALKDDCVCMHGIDHPCALLKLLRDPVEWANFEAINAIDDIMGHKITIEFSRPAFYFFVDQNKDGEKND
jgi:hypothetical protein